MKSFIILILVVLAIANSKLMTTEMIKKILKEKGDI